MGVREEARLASVAKVVAAASEVFTARGYAAASVTQIASAAGVSVGTVASVGTKDELFLRVWEEASTARSLAMLTSAATASHSPTERVWNYIGALVEASLAMPGAMRDYFVAYLRSAQHDANRLRLDEVVSALRGLLGDPADDEATQLAAVTLWLTFSSICLAIASRSITDDEARRLMRAVVEAQCAPFEGGTPCE